MNKLAIQCFLYVIIGAACSETDNEPLFTEEDFFEQTAQYTSCTTLADCRHTGLYSTNPCLCDISHNTDFRDEVFEMARMVECSEEKSPEGFECITTPDLAFCNPSGFCETPIITFPPAQ